VRSYDLITGSDPRAFSPADESGAIVRGIFFHFGPVLAFLLVLIVLGLTPLGIALAYAATGIFLPLTFAIERARPCVPLPKATVEQIASGYSVVFVKGIAVGGAFVTAGWVALSYVSPHRALSSGWGVVAAGVFFTDLGYYLLHRFMSHGRGTGWLSKVYRKAHSAHHAITHLDFLRGNESSLIDTAFSEIQPSLIVTSWALGMSLQATLVAYGIVLLMQTTDHTNVTFDIGWLRYIFLDNHVHKLHHCRRGHIVNYGAVFSIFDRMFGSYYEDWRLNGSYMHHHHLPLPILAAQASKKLSSVTDDIS
jgi:sterol desaturase/sphingolipid hydroxylase (fatty acid hydroxylase superfamily)